MVAASPYTEPAEEEKTMVAPAPSLDALPPGSEDRTRVAGFDALPDMPGDGESTMMFDASALMAPREQGPQGVVTILAGNDAGKEYPARAASQPADLLDGLAPMSASKPTRLASASTPSRSRPAAQPRQGAFSHLQYRTCLLVEQRGHRVCAEGWKLRRRPGKPCQRRFPGQYEPRNPHSHERHYWDDRSAAGNPARQNSARVPDHGP